MLVPRLTHPLIKKPILKHIYIRQTVYYEKNDYNPGTVEGN